MTIHHIYCSYWGSTAYFVTISEVTIVRCSRKHLFFKYGRKTRRVEFLEMLQAAIFFQGFPRVNGYFFKISFAEIFRNTHFLQYDSVLVSKKQPVQSAQEVLAESLETVSDEPNVLINFTVSSKPQSSPGKHFPQVNHCSSSPRKNIFQNSPPVDTSALVCIFSSILSHSYNHFHNILRHVDVLSNFPFTISETMGDYY